MSSLLIISLLLLVISSTLSNAKISPAKPKAFIFPIRKDATSNQYYTTIQIGSNATTLNTVIDLDGKFLWFYSLDYFSAARSYRPILCGTKDCDIADGAGCIFCYDSPPMLGCYNNTCSDDALNPFTGTIGYSDLGQDVLSAYSTHGAQFKVNNFPFQYSQPVMRDALATLAAGAIGLGRSRISLPSQLSSTFKIRRKFALCIPSTGSDGNMIVGNEAYREPFQRISESMWTTPLLTNPLTNYGGNDEIGNLSVSYFVAVKSVRVGATTLSLNKTLLLINNETGDGGTSIRTARAYTTLHGSIHAAVVGEFVKAAAAMKIKRVAAVAPFHACFDPKTISGGKSGPHVPTVDLVLHSKKVYWRFYGSNLMVRVGGVMCLAFVEAQRPLAGPATSIVVGGYQMENHLLEFDLASSKFGVSSSLLLSDTTCKHFGAA